MIRATTPTFRMQVVTKSGEPVDLSNANHIYISLVSDNAELQLSEADDGVDIDGNVVSVYLTQAQSLKFQEKDKIEIQVNYTYGNKHSRAATKISQKKADRNLLPEVVD